VAAAGLSVAALVGCPPALLPAVLRRLNMVLCARCSGHAAFCQACAAYAIGIHNRRWCHAADESGWCSCPPEFVTGAARVHGRICVPLPHTRECQVLVILSPEHTMRSPKPYGTSPCAGCSGGTRGSGARAAACPARTSGTPSRRRSVNGEKGDQGKLTPGDVPAAPATLAVGKAV
jgi:hypothetical protein